MTSAQVEALTRIRALCEEIDRAAKSINALTTAHELPFGKLRIPDVGRIYGDADEALAVVEVEGVT